MDSKASLQQALPLVCLIWLGLVTGGFCLLGHEEFQAGPPTTVKDAFPPHSALTLDKSHLTLLLFAHPQCPCTKTTFEELDQIRGASAHRLAITIVFVLPPHVPVGWEKGELWTQASEMKDVHVDRDVDGIEARRFGVSTSGHVLVYNPGGILLYSGGITLSRGHSGDNPGETEIVRLTLGHTPADKGRKPVFGCSLL